MDDRDGAEGVCEDAADDAAERTAREALTAADVQRLQAVRRQEATVAALAGARRQRLSQAIDQLQGEGRADKPSRMQRAYHDSSGS